MGKLNSIIGGMKYPTNSKIITLLSIVVFASILFLPGMKMGNLPAIELVDILMPIILMILLINFRNLNFKSLIIIGAIFSAYIFISIVINGRLASFSDYFEIYKLIKFIALIYLFSFVDITFFDKKIINPVFIIFFIINLIQYFNIFGINMLFEELYFGNRTYIEFGLNSAGLPVSKRLLGLTANPNNNAIILSLFAIYYSFTNKIKSTKTLFYFLSVVMIILCQSRTAIFFIPIIWIGFFVFDFKNYIHNLSKIGIGIMAVIIGYTISIYSIGIGTPINMEMVENFDKEHEQLKWDPIEEQYFNLNKGNNQHDSALNYTYLESMAHGQFVEGTSMSGRYEIWKHLFKMIQEKPLFGHGPNKKYFYENTLYAENEFIFTAWKYGIVGLIIFLSLIGYFVVLIFKNYDLEKSKVLMLVLILYGICSITNLPFSAITLNMLLAIFIGLQFTEIRKKQISLKESNHK